MELLSSEGLRSDGRRYNELRRVQGKLSVFRQVDGSSYLEQGNTKVLVTVSGPRELKQHSEGIVEPCRIELHWNEASFCHPERRRRVAKDRRLMDWMHTVKESLENVIMTEQCPNSQIDINVTLLQSDGGAIACAINATTLALMDAGIPLKDFVCASSVAFVDATPLIDINLMEESSYCPVITLAILPRSGHVTLLHVDAKLAIEQLDKVLLAGKASCLQMHGLLDNIVRSIYK